MNIFITSFDSKKAASHLDDLRLNKIFLETANCYSWFVLNMLQEANDNA